MNNRNKAFIGIGVAILGAAVWLLAARSPGGEAAGGPAGGEPPPAPVETAQARLGRVEVTVRAVGSVEAQEQTVVTSQVTGKVAAIHFAPGERVEPGEELITLDSERERAALDVARAEDEEASRQLARLRDLPAGVAVSAAQLDEARAAAQSARARAAEAEAALAERRITAPFAGVVGLRKVSPGALLQPGTPVTTLVSADAVKVQFELPAELLTRLEPGLPFAVTAPGFDETFRGRISRIDSTVDRSTRSIAVEGSLESPAEGLKPGVFAAVEAVTEIRPDAVLIPEEAIVLEGGESYVYVVGPQQRAERRAVEVGVRRFGEAEILSGLEPGTTVITRGLQKVEEGRRVRRQGSGPGVGPQAPEGQAG